jgi:Bacterial regulatory proteins, luxR family
VAGGALALRRRRLGDHADAVAAEQWQGTRSSIRPTSTSRHGSTTKHIAEILVISLKTVESHRTRISTKLGARDRVDLTRYAIRRGLIQP